MLPTLIFILWAYGMYALISALSGRRTGKYRAGGSRRRYAWLGLTAGAVAGLGLAVLLAQSFDDQEHNLKLSGFLGTVWADGWPDRMERRLEDPPMKSTPAGNQPVYALLNPGAPSTESAQEKTAPKPRPAHKPKLGKTSAPQAKGSKVTAQKSKKELVTAKGKVKTTNKTTKKKKTPPAAAKSGTAG